MKAILMASENKTMWVKLIAETQDELQTLIKHAENEYNDIIIVFDTQTQEAT